MTESFDPKPSDIIEEKEKLSKRILFADDEQGVREMYPLFLEAKGYTVDVVENGQLLLDKLFSGNEKYDLIITDNTMPGIKGTEVLKQIRADDRFKDLPVIINSGDNWIEDEVDKLGGIFLEKPPSSTAVFIETVKRALGESTG